MGDNINTPENENLKLWNTWYSEDKAQYRKFAESKRENNRFKQESLTEIYRKGREYLISCCDAGEPITITGLQIACDCDKMSFSRMRRGEYDWRLYQFLDYCGLSESDIITEHDDFLNCDIAYVPDANGELWVANTYSEIIERFYLEIQKELEILCYTSNNPKGAIFLLKSLFGWDDRQQQTGQTITAQVHVATMEEAKKAIERLALSE